MGRLLDVHTAMTKPLFDPLLPGCIVLATAGGMVGWATAAYLPFWMIFIWIAATLLSLYTGLNKTTFYGTAYLMITGCLVFDIPMLLAYAITLVQQFSP